MGDEREPPETWFESTWTDELNAVLHPLDILLSGLDAASILADALPESARTPPVEKMRTYGETEFAAIAKAANEYCETEQITADHIRAAVEGTKRHYA